MQIPCAISVGLKLAMLPLEWNKDCSNRWVAIYIYRERVIFNSILQSIVRTTVSQYKGDDRRPWLQDCPKEAIALYRKSFGSLLARQQSRRMGTESFGGNQMD